METSKSVLKDDNDRIESGQRKITMDGLDELIAQLASPTPWTIKHSGACAWQVFDANGVMIMSFLDGPVNTANVRLIVASVNSATKYEKEK